MLKNKRFIHLGVVLLLSMTFVGVALAAARQAKAEVANQVPTDGAQHLSDLEGTVDILLVDDDDNVPDVLPFYTQTLLSLGYTFAVWDTFNSDFEPDFTTLQAYKAVIWFTGDEFGGFAGPSAASEAELAAYLDNNRCLFLSSQDYFNDRGLTPFMQNYLGVSSIANDLGDYLAVVGQGSIYSSLGPFSLQYPFIDYSDIVNPDATAETAFQGVTPNTNPAGVYKNSGSYKTTFLGFPLEAVPSPFEQAQVVSRFLRDCFPNDILLVDDDDNSPDVAPFYLSTLSVLGYSYQIWDTDNADFEPTYTDLIGYDAVIWFSGDEYLNNAAGPGPQSEIELAGWLDDTGACLFLSSQDYLYNRGVTPFMTGYLGMEGGSSDVGQTVVTGTQTYAGLGPYFLTYPLSMSNYSDAFTPTVDAKIALIGNQAIYTGGEGLDSNKPGLIQTISLNEDDLSYAAGLSKDNGWYFTTWLGFPFEALPNPLARERVMHRFLSNCFEADLAVHKYTSDPVVNVGESFTFTLEINNFGPNRATNIIVSDFVPSQVAIDNIFASTANCNVTLAGDVLCIIPELQVGQYELIDIGVTAVQPGGLTNFLFATNLGADPFPGNNSTSRFVRVLPPGYTAPIVDKVSPPVSSIISDTNIMIEGANFVTGTRVFLGNTELLSPTVKGDTQIYVYVPAGTVPQGAYGVHVLNPNGEADTLPNAMAFYDSSVFTISEVIPAEGLNDRPNTLNIFGDGFAPGMTGKLIDTLDPLVYFVIEDIQYVSPNLVRAEVPYEISPGVYDVLLYNLENISTTLPAGYHALDGFTADDLFALDYDIFTIPSGAREGDNILIGLNVRRRTGPFAPAFTETVNVDVGFGVTPTGLNAPFATTDVTGVISANTTISLTFPFTVPAAGDYTLLVDITSPDLSPDSNPANNVVTRTFTVLPPASDTVPPQVDSMTINGGALVTNDLNVVINTTASDSGTGLGYIYYIEYAYNRNLGDWEPVASSGWQPFDEASVDVEWKMQPIPGLHFIQAWVSDLAGNVSLPKSSSINMIPTKSTIVHDGGQVFRIPLNAGNAIQINLTSLTGDADMFVWSHDGSLLAFADDFTPLEEIIFVAPEDGIYQIDVYGHETATYWFEITPVAPALTPEEILGHVKGGDRPLQVVENEPGSDANVPSPPVESAPINMNVYLPVMIR